MTEMDFVHWFDDTVAMFDHPNGFRRAVPIEKVHEDYPTEFSSEDEELDCNPVLFGTSGRRSAQSPSPISSIACAQCKLETRWCDCPLQP